MGYWRNTMRRGRRREVPRRYGSGSNLAMGRCRTWIMSSASQGRVEQMMRSHCGTLAEMPPFLNSIAGSLTARIKEKIILPSYSNDDSSVWKEIHRKLSAEGFLSSSISRHKDTIIAYIVELGDRGVLDEVDAKTMKLESASGNVAAAGPKPMHLGAIQEDEEYCEDNGQDNDGSPSMDSREEENLANVDVLSSRFSQDQYLNEYGAAAFDSDLSSNLEEKPTSQDLSKVLEEPERVNNALEIPSDVVAEKQKETREEYWSDESVNSWERMDKPAVVKANSSISRNEDSITSGKEREASKEESSVEVVSLQPRLAQKMNIDHETPMTEGSAALRTKAVSQSISPGLSLRKAALRVLGRPPPALSSLTEDDRAPESPIPAREEPSSRFYIGRECMECKAKCPTSFIFKALCSSGHKQQLCLTCLNYLFGQELFSYRLNGQCLGFTFWKQSPVEHSCGGVTILFQDVRHILSEKVQKAWKIWAVESNSLICGSCGRLIAEHNIRTSKQKSEGGTKTTTHGHCDSCEKDTCHVYQNIIDGHEMHKESMGLDAD